MNTTNQLYSQVVLYAKKSPDKVCLTEASTGNTITYQQILSALFAFNNAVGSDPQTFLVALEGGIVDSIWWLLSLTAGHTIIPVSPQLTPHEYEDIVKNHSVDIIVSDSPTFRGKSHIPVFSHKKCIDILELSRNSHSYDTYVPRDGFDLLYTSGSTGKPKGIILTTRQIVHTASSIIESHMLTDKDRGFTPLPFYHVNAPVVSLVTTILSGSSLVIAPKFSLSKFWKWIKTYDPTWISLVPTIITLLMKTEKPAFLSHSSLRFIRTASAPLPAITLTRFEEKFNIPVIETYGISEGASTITANPVPPGIHKPGSVGLPVGVVLCIADTSPDDKKIHQLPQGAVGEICVKGPGIISSYENNADASSFRDGWFCTGDMGYIDADGYVFITGRKKDVINRGGEIIAPREIEDVLLTYPGVQEAIVVGHPDPIYGEKIVAMVRTTLNNIQESDVINHVSSQLSPQKIPARIYVLHSFPKGRTGKIDRNALRNESGLEPYLQR